MIYGSQLTRRCRIRDAILFSIFCLDEGDLGRFPKPVKTFSWSGVLATKTWNTEIQTCGDFQILTIAKKNLHEHTYRNVIQRSMYIRSGFPGINLSI